MHFFQLFCIQGLVIQLWKQNCFKHFFQYSPELNGGIQPILNLKALKLYMESTLSFISLPRHNYRISGWSPVEGEVNTHLNWQSGRTNSNSGLGLVGSYTLRRQSWSWLKTWNILALSYPYPLNKCFSSSKKTSKPPLPASYSSIHELTVSLLLHESHKIDGGLLQG